MRKLLAVILALALTLGLTACGPAEEPASPASDAAQSGAESVPQQNPSNILIAYAPTAEGDVVDRAAGLLQDTLGGDLFRIEEGAEGDFTPYEFVLLGFAAENNTLPEAVQDFLTACDFGAKTIIPFVSGDGNTADSLFSAISALQPGALMGDSVLPLSDDTGEAEITQWARELGLNDAAFTPESGDGSTVATAAVTPGEQQVLYLWEEGNAPAVTEYTVNNGGYSDDPDFRPYLTSFPVPAGTPIKGAVLICPGGACGSAGGADSAEQSSAAREDMGTAGANSPAEGGGNILIAYFTAAENSGVDAIASASFTTINGQAVGRIRAVADMIQENVGGDLFSIRTSVVYPTDGGELIDYAAAEQEENARPELTSHIENLDRYDTIFIGYPNWWADLPMAVYSFFDEYDFSGKTLISFNVHNGSRFSRTIQTIEELEPDATVVEDGFTVSERDVAQAAGDVAAWLEELGY